MELLWIITQAVYVIACVLLIFFVLIQESKGEGLAGVFGGGGGSQTLFGSSAPTVVHKATIYCAILFMGLGFLLMFRTPTRTTGGSVMEGVATSPPTATSAEEGEEAVGGGAGEGEPAGGAGTAPEPVEVP
jgi:preprotein translocase subunit SecG